MKLIVALAIAPGAVAALRGNPHRRRLEEQLDMPAIEEAASQGHLGSKLDFKLDAAHALVVSGQAAELADAIGNKIGCGAASRIFPPAGRHEADQAAFGLDMWYAVPCARETGDKFAMSDETLEKLKTFLASDDGHDGIQVLEPELEVHTTWTPNDPKMGQQPHYNTIKMKDAWEIEKGTPNVVVHVLDTGIDANHPDLKDMIWENPGEIPGDGIDNDNNGFVDDFHGYNFADMSGTNLLGSHWHGTHCGGTIAADSNNGQGVAGVAGGDQSSNSGVRLMIGLGFGASTGGFAASIVYAANNGAHVSSNSWGYTAPGAYEQAVLAAIDYFNSKDGIVVFAAGNDNSASNYYPGFYSGSVAVAATSSNKKGASFTNYGDWIDIAAPGVSIYSTMLNNGYGYSSGTSMACPHVAGVLALGKSRDFGASRDKLLGCMTSTAMNIDSVQSNNKYKGNLGAGMIDAPAFLTCVGEGLPPPAPVPTPTPTPAPFPAPTHSFAPTPDCRCDQEFVVKLKTDKYPGETKWTLKAQDQNHPCKGSKNVWKGGPYTDDYKEYEDVVTGEICGGQKYRFEITDSWGDGICCLEGQGWYEGVLEDAAVFKGGEFKKKKVHTFDAPESGGDDGSGDWPDDKPELAPLQVVDVEPPMSGKRVGPVAMMAWTADVPATLAEHAHNFKVEYRTEKDAPWEEHSEGDRAFHLEPDGKFYAVLPNAPCGLKMQLRVTGVGSDWADAHTTEPVTSKPRRISCEEDAPASA